jgi:hypothetical protein
MRNLKLFIPAMLLILVASSFTMGRWRIIGQKEANYGVDRDVIVVKGNDIYKAIKIKVVDAGLNMLDLDVYFENGEKMNVSIQKNFHQGEESRVIDFPGNKRRIEKISFLYDTKGILKGKANVIVYGKK